MAALRCTLGAACVLLLGAGCAQLHGPAAGPTPPAAGPAAGEGGAGSSANPAGAAGRSPAPVGEPAPSDAGTTRAGSGAGQGVEPVDASFGSAPCELHLPDTTRPFHACPAVAGPGGEPCAAEDENAACVYGAVLQSGESPGAVVATCTGAPQPTWVVDGAPCGHHCPAHGPLSQPFAVDTSTCAERDLQPCGPGLTDQSQLDGMVHGVMERTGFPLSWIQEGALTVEFEAGCPSGITGVPVDASADVAKLNAALRGVRWACAQALGCGVVVGPSTLATQ